MGKINKEIIRVAVVGAGAMATNIHFPSLATIKGVEIVGVCDINVERMKVIEEKYKIKNTYTNYQKMIEETKPDAAYVFGPPHHMYDIWIWCLKRGLNLYIEKPMGTDLHQAMNLVQLAKDNHCITQVSLQRRNSPILTQMLAKCREKGPVIHAMCTFTKGTNGPILQGYDEMHDTTIHALDTLRSICGGEIVKIESVSKRVGISNFNFFLALVHFDNGATGILVSNHASGRRSFSFEIHCPQICAVAELEGKGALYYPGYGRKLTHYTDIPDGMPFDAKEAAGSSEYFIYGGYRAKHEEFINCLRSGEQPSSCFSDALKTHKACSIILAQALLKGSPDFEKVVTV